MKKFILCDLQSGVEDEYDGEYVENSTYRFVNTQKDKDSLIVAVLGPKKISLRRTTESFEIFGILEENQIGMLNMKMKIDEKQRCGEFPILVRNVDIEYPAKIMLRYHLLDEKNVPIETCQISVSEKL